MRALLVVVATALVVLGPAHAAHTETGTYTIGSTPGLSVVCSPDCLGEPGLNIGGYAFAATGEVPASITISDQSGGPVSFTVCQDPNEALCGETGEPNVEGCATEADLAESEVGFLPDQQTWVFIRVTAPDCVGPAVGGTVTMTFEAQPPTEE